MSRPSKKILQRAHAKTRCRQRLGININRREYRNIVEKIRDRKFEITWKQSCRVSHYRGKIKMIPVIIIYDHFRNTIITIYRETELYYNNLKKWEEERSKN